MSLIDSSDEDNKIAMITILSSMSREEGDKVQHCQSAKEVW